jgi:hypothetical protein
MTMPLSVVGLTENVGNWVKLATARPLRSGRAVGRAYVPARTTTCGASQLPPRHAHIAH